MTLQLFPSRNPARAPLSRGRCGLGRARGVVGRERSNVPFDARCETWDGGATAAVAELIADRSPTVEQRLGDVVFRLRRARTYCRHGFVGLAELDYQALMDGRYAGISPARREPNRRPCKQPLMGSQSRARVAGRRPAWRSSTTTRSPTGCTTLSRRRCAPLRCPPYFHGGSAANLYDVIKLYEQAVSTGRGDRR